MKLKKVEIKNFRSIEHLEIMMEKNTKIFLGLSGTGKTNLLKALSTLSENTNISRNDVRENCNSDSESSVEFTFNLSSNDKTAILANIKSNCFGCDLNKVLFKNEENISIDYFFEQNYFYYVDINKEANYFKANINDNLNDYNVNEKYKMVKVNPGRIVNIISNDETKKMIQLKKDSIINLDLFTCNMPSFLVELTPELFNTFINNTITEYMEEKRTEVIFWRYSEENLLPSEIDTLEFIKNPDICIPLKKIFNLCGYDDIKKEYDFRKSTGRINSFENLLEEISTKTTDYLKKKWGSRVSLTKFVISESGTKLRISVKDSKNKFEITDRSDGFKRFISFLIMVSIDNARNQLKDNLILLDCPEAEIDIPGQKYLRDELIDIGKNNYVFYTTHSQHMIDNKNIYRHYIVKKEDEITKIETVDESNYHDSIILLNALGTSLFENICDCNLVFEGWTDKYLFNEGISFLDSTLKEKLKKISICQLGGLRNIGGFSTVWQIVCSSKKYIIISDSDKPAFDSKKLFDESHFDENYEWFMYGNLEESNKKIETAEDYLEPKYIKNICDEYSEENKTEKYIDIEKLEDNSTANMPIIEAWIKEFHTDKESIRIAKGKIKEMLFCNVKLKNIKEEYKIFLEKLLEKI